MKEEVERYLKNNSNKYLMESYFGGRVVDTLRLCDDLKNEFPEITVEELREAIPAVLRLAE